MEKRRHSSAQEMKTKEDTAALQIAIFESLADGSALEGRVVLSMAG
jgi:hypothetical protein